MFERLRAAWRAFWNSTTAPVAVDEAAEQKPPRSRISNAVLWEAERHGSPAFLPEQIYQAATPVPGTLPEGMALDYMPSSQDAMIGYALQQMYHEGLGFLGYPYLAELSQRAEYRKIASIWAKHCTRKWIKVTGDDAKVKKIEEELERLNVRAMFQSAIEKECFFGRVHLFMDFGDWDKPNEVRVELFVDKRKISPNRPIKRLGLVEPMWSYPGPYDAQNPLAPNFYRPDTWYVSGRTVHSSRLLTMVGHEMPNMLKPAYAFGGVSLTQMCKPYVDNWLRVRQSSSDLVSAFSTMVLKTDMEAVLGGGSGDPLFARIDLFNKTRDNRGTFVLDKNAEDFTNVSAPIAGLDKLVSQAQEQIASVASIPLVVLLGVTPTGLNASSEGEIRVFYDAIDSYNEDVVGPALRRLLEVVQLSLFGEINDDIGFEFVPLWEMSDKDKADIRKADAEADVAYINAGVVDPEEARERLRNDESSLYHGVDLTAPAPEPPADEGGDDDEVKLPFADDEWREGDHPRDEDGKFGSGGGGAHELSGEEVAPHDASPSELRAAAKTYFDTHLRGRKVESKALGHEVGFSTAGFKEARTWSAHPDKLRLFPAVPSVIEHGHLVKSEEPRSDRERRSVTAYHTIEAPVTLRGERLTMQVVVMQASNGSFHYDHWALEHRKGPTASDEASPNPKSGAIIGSSEATSGNIGHSADSINIYFRREE